MANQDKTNTNQGNTQSSQADEANVGKEATKGNPSDWNTQKTGQTGNKQGQMGGKSPPSGGPDRYKPEEPMEGKPTGSGGNPYPPATPERPLMAEGQGKNKGISGGQASGGQQVNQQGASKSGESGSKGEFGSSSDETGSRFAGSDAPAVGEAGEFSGKPVGEEEEEE